MHFIDSHAHLNSTEFKENWKNVVTTAKESGLSAIINIAGDRFDSEWGVHQAEEEPIVYATVGEHPESLHGQVAGVDELINNLRRLILNSSKVVGIGELGLDYTLDPKLASKQAQIDLITPQLQLAQELHLPVVLHVRDQPGQTDCFNDLLSLLQQFTTSANIALLKTSPSTSRRPGAEDDRISLPQAIAKDATAEFTPIKSGLQHDSTTSILSHPSFLTGIFHCWTGTPKQLEQALELPGFYVSFSGILTYKSAGHILDAAKLVPDDRLLIETDAPYLLPEPRRSQIRRDKTQFPLCQPADVIMTAQKLADIRNQPLEQIAKMTSANAKTIFRLPTSIN